MGLNGIEEVLINGRRYKYTVLAPIEALRFGTEVAKVLGPGIARLSLGSKAGSFVVGEFIEMLAPALEAIDAEKVQNLLTTVFAHTYTADNENLGNEAVFNSWFKKYPEDIFQVGFTVLFYLVKDFFPKLPATSAG